MSEPIDATEIRLDLLRGRVGLEIAAVAGLAKIADICVQHRFDDLLVSTMVSARERMVSGLALLKKLEQQRADAAFTAEAAVEWRERR